MDTILLDISAKGFKILRPFKWIAYAGGCNIMYRTKFVHPLKLLNLFLLTIGIIGGLAQLHFFWNCRHQSIDVYIESILIFFQILISICKLWFHTFSQQDLYAVIQAVQDSDILKDLEIFELDLIDQDKIITAVCRILKSSWCDINFQLIFLMVNVFSICGWYSVHSLILNIYYIYNGRQLTELPFPFPASFPKWYDDERLFVCFLVEYFIIVLEIYLATMSSITFAGLFSIISVHCLTLLRILHKLISYSTSEHVLPKDRQKYLEACIKLHQKIHGFCNQLNSLYRMPAFLMFLVYCLIICLLTFHASVDKNPDIYRIFKVIFYISSILFEICIFCFNGQRLTTESDLLPLAIYECTWYDEDDHFRFMTQIMIMRSNHSITMDVGGFARMSLVTLLSIVRSSASYFLFLRKCM